jgi:hypothetical protein
MCSITNLFSCKPDRLRKIPTACVSAGGSKKVSIKVFDKKHLIGDVTRSIEAVRQKLETFFNRLHEEPLPPAVAQNLQSFSFEVLFMPRDSTAVERQAFGMMDFPIYLDTTEGAGALTEGPVQDLLKDHGIPDLTKVKLIVSDTENQFITVKSRDEIKSFMKDEEQKDLGIGLPGTYFIQGSQAQCRKLAIIKMNLIKRNPVFDTREPKFISGFKHELGHMFGMDHEDGTLMDPNNREAANHPIYTANQIRVLTEVLTIISR